MYAALQSGTVLAWLGSDRHPVGKQVTHEQGAGPGAGPQQGSGLQLEGMS